MGQAGCGGGGMCSTNRGVCRLHQVCPPPPVQAAREAAEAEARAKAEAKAAERAVREAEKEVEAKRRAAEKAAAKEAARAEKEAARAAAKAAKDEGKEDREKAKAARAEAAAAKTAAKAARQQRKRSGALGQACLGGLWTWFGMPIVGNAPSGCGLRLTCHHQSAVTPAMPQPRRARSLQPRGRPPAAATGSSALLRCPRLKRRPRHWGRPLWLQRRMQPACSWASLAAVQMWRPCRPTWQLRMARGSGGPAEGMERRSTYKPSHSEAADRARCISALNNACWHMAIIALIGSPSFGQCVS